MTDYGMSIELPTGIAEARERVEAALAEDTRPTGCAITRGWHISKLII